MSNFLKDPESLKGSMTGTSKDGSFSGKIRDASLSVADKQAAKDSCCPSLTLKQRLIGFTICMTIGVLLDILSFGILFSALSGDISRFAIPYAIGAIFSILGSMFLCGPLKQLKSMFHKKRVITTIVFLLAIIMVLVSALAIESPILVLIFIIIQYCAFTWYCLSYVPYGRELFCKGFKRCICRG